MRLLARDDRVPGRFLIDPGCYQSPNVVVPAMCLEDIRDQHHHHARGGAFGASGHKVGIEALRCMIDFRLFVAPLRAEMSRLDPEVLLTPTPLQCTVNPNPITVHCNPLPDRP